MKMREMMMAGLFCLSSLAMGQDNYSQWHAYRPLSLTVSGLGLGAGATTNFPLLVRLSSSNFDFSTASATGADIRFSNGTGSKHLPYQIERWDTASHSAAVWVLMDTVSLSSSLSLRMYYGKSGAVDSSRGDLVFSTSNNYQGVFHLGEALNDTIRDATGNRFKGVPKNRGGSNPADLTGGLIGKAKDFLGNNNNNNGGSYQILQSNGSHTYDVNPLNFQNDSSTLNGLAQYTVSAWIYQDTIPRGTANLKGIVAKSGGLNARQFHLRQRDPAPDQISSVNDTSRVEFNDGVGSVYKSGSHRLTLGSWYHMVAVRSGTVGDSTHLRMYVDGGNVVYGGTSLTQTTRSDYDVYIGSFSNDSGYFDGKIDEVEFSNIARDSNWVKLSYQTQKSGAGVVTVGGEVIPPPAPAFTYRTSPLTLTTTVAMTADTPQVTGGSPTGWSVSPALPPGLTFNTLNGIISGTAVLAQASANYTVTANNGSGGTGTAAVSIAVNSVPVISNHPATQTVTGLVTSVRFGIHATGTPAPSYRWVRTRGVVVDTPSNGGTAPAAIFSGMTTDTMTITNAPYSDSNSTYKCVAYNVAGGVVSNSATLGIHVTVGILGPFVVKVPGLRPFAYRIPEGAAVSVLMTVEDIQGRVVWSKEQAVEKSRVVSWSGKDGQGRGVSSGMYVVKLRLLDAQHTSLSELRQTGGITH